MTKFILAVLIFPMTAGAQSPCNDILFMSTAHWQRVDGVSPHEAALVRILTFRPSGQFVEVDTWVAHDKGSTKLFVTLGEGYVIRRGVWKWLISNRVLVDSHVDSSAGFVLDKGAKQSKRFVYLVGKNTDHVFGSTIRLGGHVFRRNPDLKNGVELQTLMTCPDDKS